MRYSDAIEVPATCTLNSLIGQAKIPIRKMEANKLPSNLPPGLIDQSVDDIELRGRIDVQVDFPSRPKMNKRSQVTTQVVLFSVLLVNLGMASSPAATNSALEKTGE
jgi:hypothetical protein